MSRFRCHNEVFGCGEQVDARGYNLAVLACTTCVGEAARRWRVKPGDLHLVLVAFQAAKATTARRVDGDPSPTLDEVWAVLREAFQLEPVVWIPPMPKSAPRDSQLPEADRAAA